MFGFRKMVPRWAGNGLYQMQVAGTSFQHEALKDLARNPAGAPSLMSCLASVRPTPILEDPLAVAVHIEGTHIGYVPRDLAPTYCDALFRLGIEGKEVSAAAVITNGLQTETNFYNYTVELDIDFARWELQSNPRKSAVRIERHQPYPKLVQVDATQWRVRVWIPVASSDELHRNLEVGHWTNEKWTSVNFYVSNRRGIGLGFKLFEVEKTEFERVFGSDEIEARLSDMVGRWATLTLRRMPSHASD
jgi:hypothetical protein